MNKEKDEKETQIKPCRDCLDAESNHTCSRTPLEEEL